MNCPSCRKNLNYILSICPSCGTMVNDSVREELSVKISPAKVSPKTIEMKGTASKSTIMANQSIAIAQSVAATNQTGEILAKNTSPTLVDFPTKPAIPEWRLQLQNAVRNRQDKSATTTVSQTFTTRRRSFSNKGASALAMDLYENVETEKEVNPTLARALKRIEKSKSLYTETDQEQTFEPKPAFEIKPVQAKTYQFAIPNKTFESLPIKSSESLKAYQETTEVIEKPIFEKVAQPIEAKSNAPKHLGLFDESKDNLDGFLKSTESDKTRPERYKTNKLPALSAKISASFEKIRSFTGINQDVSVNLDNKRVEVSNLEQNQPDINANDEVLDDIPPFSMRFNSGLFDLLIGGFLSFVLLSPFMLMGGQWFTIEGFFGFLATCTIVMFIYLTTSIGLLGKTLGMMLFQLEVVDIEDNDYPSFHQAAVSSSVYLLSLALGGLGFLTIRFNSEKRAAHDLVSNTIVVKEI